MLGPREQWHPLARGDAGWRDGGAGKSCRKGAGRAEAPGGRESQEREEQEEQEEHEEGRESEAASQEASPQASQEPPGAEEPGQPRPLSTQDVERHRASWPDIPGNASEPSEPEVLSVQVSSSQMVPVKLELQATEAEQVGSLGPLGPILNWCHQENAKNKEFFKEQLAEVKAADRQERKEDREFLANFFKEQLAEQRKFYKECLELQASHGRASSGSFQPGVPVKVESSEGEERLGGRVEVDPKSLGWRALLHG